MGLFSGTAAGVTRCNTIASRTGESGGNVGGNKNAGIFAGAIGWSRGNIPASVFARAPQRTTSITFAIRNTTNHPVQRKRNGYSVTTMM